MLQKITRPESARVFMLNKHNPGCANSRKRDRKKKKKKRSHKKSARAKKKKVCGKSGFIYKHSALINSLDINLSKD